MQGFNFREQIIQELKKIEKEKSVVVLYAVESGSRVWGFASKDSDWDVRFIYIHQIDWYLSIEDKKDTIEEMLPNNIDLSGWELQKSLKLFKKSNPPLLEWLNSPMVYKEQSVLARKLRLMMREYFNPKSCMYHYLHMAEGNYREYLQGDRVRVKKYFYVLRPILACQWIECKNTMPPTEFQKLLDTLVENKNLKKEIEALLLRKQDGQELNDEPKIQVINDFLEEKIIYFKTLLQTYTDYPQPDTYKLSRLFRETLQETYGIKIYG